MRVGCSIVKLNFFLSWRYIRGRSKRGLSLTAILSFSGVFIGTTLLVIVLSVFNGFQAQIKNSIFKFDPHITIEDNQTAGKGIIKDWPKWVETIKSDFGKYLESVEPMIQSAAIVKKGKMIDHIFLRGQFMHDEVVIPSAVNQPSKKKEQETGEAAETLKKNKNTSLIKKQTKQARAEKSDKPVAMWRIPKDFPRISHPKGLTHLPKTRICLIGAEMAANMQLRVGDFIHIIVPRGQFLAHVGMKPRMRAYRISGTFKTGHYQYDSRVVVLPFESAQRLYDIHGGTQQLVLKLKDVDDLERVRRKANLLFGYPFYVHTVEDDQRNFFAALQIEKIVTTVIVFLFIIAAIFIIIVVTLHMVLSKKKDIGILKALGLSSGNIMGIFTAIGFVMATFGSAMGLLAGIFLSLNLENIIMFIAKIYNGVHCYYVENYTDEFCIIWHPIPKGIYYFDHIPISIEPNLLITLASVSIVLAALGSLIPAYIASRLDPMEILRRGDI